MEFSRGDLKSHARKMIKIQFLSLFLLIIIYPLVFNIIESLVKDQMYGIISMLVSLVISAVIPVCIATVTIKASKGEEVKSTDFFKPFSKNIINIIITRIVSFIIIFFNYLLLIVPGIIKSFEYSMIPYILAEEPDTDNSRVRGKSIEMMRGHKMQYFVLILSFILLYIVAGVGATFIGSVITSYSADTLYESYIQQDMSLDQIVRSYTSGNYVTKSLMNVLANSIISSLLIGAVNIYVEMTKANFYRVLKGESLTGENLVENNNDQVERTSTTLNDYINYDENTSPIKNKKQ